MGSQVAVHLETVGKCILKLLHIAIAASVDPGKASDAYL